MSTIQLIGYPISPSTLRVVFTLNELNVPYELTPPKGFGEIKEPEYLAKKHPFGKMPVLIDGDFTITESRSIARYLVSKYQGKFNSTILIPDDVHKAARVDQFLSYDTCYYDPPVSQIVYQEFFAKYHEGPSAEKLEEARKNTESVFEVYEKLLEGKDYLTGEFSLADIVHYPFSHYAIKAGHGSLWDSKPNIKRWKDTIAAREAWQKILEQIKE